MSSENQEQPIENQKPVVIEQPNEQTEQPAQKTRKVKIYVKKGTDSRGRPATEGKTTAYGLPVDPNYYSKYYAEKLAIKVQCEQCLMYVAKVNSKSCERFFKNGVSVVRKGINNCLYLGFSVVEKTPKSAFNF